MLEAMTTNNKKINPFPLNTLAHDVFARAPPVFSFSLPRRPSPRPHVEDDVLECEEMTCEETDEEGGEGRGEGGRGTFSLASTLIKLIAATITTTASSSFRIVRIFRRSLGLSFRSSSLSFLSESTFFLLAFFSSFFAKANATISERLK